ncbi:MAG: DUF2283 domain-containing protein [Candidatus Kapabacteria bacterium]|nr:DUF2283 domain-containing protein [Candidatus Kapabacteria bacterium]
MKMLYDKQVDALYIQFKQITNGSAMTTDLSESVSINYDREGKIAGIEILDASKIMDNLTELKLFEQNYKVSELVYA